MLTPHFLSFRSGLVAVAISCIPHSTAYSQTITLGGTVVNVCVLTLTTPGVVTVSPTGTELSTSETGGSPATLTVVATGTNPTITFSSVGISGPSAGGSTAELAYSSAGGASSGYTGSGYVYSVSQLIDTVTINGRAINSSGFLSGAYSLTSTATCSQ